MNFSRMIHLIFQILNKYIIKFLSKFINKIKNILLFKY